MGAASQSMLWSHFGEESSMPYTSYMGKIVILNGLVFNLHLISVSGTTHGALHPSARTGAVFKEQAFAQPGRS